MNKVVLSFICLFCITIFANCQRMPVPGFSFGLPFRIVSEKEQAFYMAVNFGTVEEIEVFLKEGHNPNYMDYMSAIPWHDNNPLWAVHYSYEKSELFIRYGADVKNRPYIYQVLFQTPILSEKYPDNIKLLENMRTRNEKDVYKFVKLFLEAGASPNLKGAPNTMLLSFNRDKAYKKYFEEKGELPINSAIEDSAFTIVDLLLEYGAIIDETSLNKAKETTERIGNDDMEKYVQAIWEKQKEK